CPGPGRCPCRRGKCSGDWSPRGNRNPATYTSRWWFERMRQIVDRAFDWQPAQMPRPEQIWLPGTHRELRLNS
ncbi:MAG: hypothetical protein NT154_05465, partial [Verrucomicrobia bacterium]|nr:hypothetical protein [Verrucomicrobiota bacterium]